MRLSENRERVKRLFEISSSPTAANGYEWLRMVTNGYVKNAETAPEEAVLRKVSRHSIESPVERSPTRRLSEIVDRAIRNTNEHITPTKARSIAKEVNPRQ